MKPAPQLDLFSGSPTPAALQGSAIFSDCRRYRFLLSRWWAPGPRALFVMMNPSVAGADPADSDPTVTRQIERARRLGASGLNVVNVWPYIATDPDDLWAQPEAVRVGPLVALEHSGPVPANDIAIAKAIEDSAAVIVVGWGASPTRKTDREHWRARTEAVLGLIRHAERHAYCLGTNGDGSPAHPLYVGYERPLEPYGEGHIR